MLSHQHFQKEMPHPGRDRPLIPSTEPKRRCISYPTNSVAAIAFPDSNGMENDQSTTINAVTVNDEPVKTIGVHLSTTEIVGKQFDEYIKDIWSSLMDDGVFRIGIHGIGGVGKTEVAKHFHNKLLEIPNKFHHVYWVDMSPDWSTCNQAAAAASPPPRRVFDVQTSISKAVGVYLSDGDDETKRAAQLSLGLAEKKKSVLILDDVWDYISLQNVGVPVGVDGCAVVITTRSLEVCRQFRCKTNIGVRCLQPDESSELLRKTVGNEKPISREVDEISKLVADKCVCLPLAITVIARNMKGVADMDQWTSASSQGHMWKKVYIELFQKLKDPTLQRCFLCCPLFVGADKRRLVDYLVDGGVIGRLTTRREELDKARTMLQMLCDVGLLEISSFGCVKMNEVVRSMALQIMEENQQPTMVKNCMSLKDLPGKESWTEDLVGVSLKQNEIESVPSHFSPSCSKLSTLLLSANRELRCIGDLFFEGMPGLKVLDLSFTDIENLPSAACSLVNLTTLLLKWCKKLRNIPSVAKLRALKKLDLSFTGVGEVPEDIGTLSELTYLDLFFTPIEDSKSKTLAKLSNLQYLRLPWSSPVSGGDFAYLSRLETLTCSFYDVFELNKYLILLKWFKETKPRAPLELHVQVGGAYRYQESYTGGAHILFHDDDDGIYADKGDDWSLVGFKKCNINEVDLLNYFQEIVIRECNEARNLCNFSRFEGVSKLKYVSVKKCVGIEMLFPLSLQSRAILENLEYLVLYQLDNLSVLLRTEGELVFYGSCFSNLKRFVIQECRSIKRLFPVRLMRNMKNLKRLYVIDCPVMEEIFASSSSSEEESNVVCGLSGLSVFFLQNLPELRRICGGKGNMCGIPESCSLKISRRPKLTTTEGVCLYKQSP